MQIVQNLSMFVWPPPTNVQLIHNQQLYLLVANRTKYEIEIYINTCTLFLGFVGFQNSP